MLHRADARGWTGDPAAAPKARAGKVASYNLRVISAARSGRTEKPSHAYVITRMLHYRHAGQNENIRSAGVQAQRIAGNSRSRRSVEVIPRGPGHCVPAPQVTKAQCESASEAHSTRESVGRRSVVLQCKRMLNSVRQRTIPTAPDLLRRTRNTNNWLTNSYI
jgi:hypothetical protein